MMHSSLMSQQLSTFLDILHVAGRLPGAGFPLGAATGSVALEFSGKLPKRGAAGRAVTSGIKTAGRI
jgi:hypothetical protein